MENMLFVVIMIFVGMVVGARFIVGILRIFPFFTLLSFGGQSSSNNNNKNSDGGGGAIGWTMIFVFLLSFFLMFVYYEGKIVDVEENIAERYEPASPAEEKDSLIPESLDRINPQMDYNDGLISVGHNLPQVERPVETDEFKNDISSIDRSTLIEDPSIRSLAELEVENQVVFYFQVAATSKKAFALKRVDELKDKTDKDVFLGMLKEYGPVPYKVLIGPFYERSEAKKFGRRNGLEGFAREVEDLQLYRR